MKSQYHSKTALYGSLAAGGIDSAKVDALDAAITAGRKLAAKAVQGTESKHVITGDEEKLKQASRAIKPTPAPPGTNWNWPGMTLRPGAAKPSFLPPTPNGRTTTPPMSASAPNSNSHPTG